MKILWKKTSDCCFFHKERFADKYFLQVSLNGEEKKNIALCDKCVKKYFSDKELKRIDRNDEDLIPIGHYVPQAFTGIKSFSEFGKENKTPKPRPKKFDI